MVRTKQEKINCVISELRNFLYDLEDCNLCKENQLAYISTILIDAGIESEFVVEVLEDEEFEEEGKDVARNIKIEEGW